MLLLLLLLQRFVTSSTCGQQYDRRLLANCRFDAVAAAHVIVVRVAAGNSAAVAGVTTGVVAAAIAVVFRMGNER